MPDRRCRLLPMGKRDPRVDTYIAKAGDFARPILKHLRELVHKACADFQEEIKWSRPCFIYRGGILCGMAAFKEHCSFSFWGAEIGSVLFKDGVIQDGGMGSLGRITSLQDLPPDKQLLGYIKQAVAFVDEGKGQTFIAANRRVAKPPKPPLEPPPEFLAALEKNRSAVKAFGAFSPSCKREYVEWITEAKRPETRDRRIAQSVEWISEGKQRNWKYKSC